MAKGFNLTAQLYLAAPKDVRNVISGIESQLKRTNIELRLRFNPATSRNISGLTGKLDSLSKSLNSVAASSSNTERAINALNVAAQRFASSRVSSSIDNTTKALTRTSRATSVAKNEIEAFGAEAGRALKRFGAFTLATGAVFGFIRSIERAIEEAVEFQHEVVRISQVTGKTISELDSLVGEVTRLSKAFGVSSKEILNIAQILAQAGLSAKDTQSALQAIAKSSLAPTFKDMENTTEGAIAAMAQFKLETVDLEAALGSLNSVSAAFAVESEDLISVIRRAGGVFASASAGLGNFENESKRGLHQLNELAALFTSVRATTRESAESIATGLRTIFSRIQRKSTIDFLKQFNIQLEEAGRFVGIFEAFSRINEGLSRIPDRSVVFAQIVEELGGFRQVSKVLPLIQNFGTATEALGVAQQGQTSLTRDAILAQQSLALQFAKTRENFLALIREFADSTTFQNIIRGSLNLANAFIEIARSLKPLLPLLATVGGINLARMAIDFRAGVIRSFSSRGKASVSHTVGQTLGNAVTGAGNRSATQQNNEIGRLVGKLHETNVELDALRFAITKLTTSILQTRASAGIVRPRGFAAGGRVTIGSGNKDDVPALLMKGEYVLNKNAVQNVGLSTLDALNSGRIRRFATGGFTSSSTRNLDRIRDLRASDIQQLQRIVDSLRSASVTAGLDPQKVVDLITENSKVLRDEFGRVRDVLVKSNGELVSIRSLVGTDLEIQKKTIESNLSRNAARLGDRSTVSPTVQRNLSIIPFDSAVDITRRQMFPSENVLQPMDPQRRDFLERQLGIAEQARAAGRAIPMGGLSRELGQLNLTQTSAVFDFLQKRAKEEGLARDAYTKQLTKSTRIITNANNVVTRVTNRPIFAGSEQNLARRFGRGITPLSVPQSILNGQQRGPLFPTFQRGLNRFGLRGGRFSPDGLNRLTLGSFVLSGASGLIPQDTAGGASAAGFLQGAGVGVGTLASLGVSSVAGLGIGAVAAGAVIALQSFAEFEKSKALERLGVASGKLEEAFNKLGDGTGSFSQVIDALAKVQNRESISRRATEFNRQVSLDGLLATGLQLDGQVGIVLDSLFGREQHSNVFRKAGFSAGVQSVLTGDFTSPLAERGTLEFAQFSAGIDARRQAITEARISELRRNPNATLSDAEINELALFDDRFRTLFEDLTTQLGSVDEARERLLRQGAFRSAAERVNERFRGTAEDRNRLEALSTELGKLRNVIDTTTSKFRDLSVIIDQNIEAFKVNGDIQRNTMGLFSGGFNVAGASDFGLASRKLANVDVLSLEELRQFGGITAGTNPDAQRALRDIEQAKIIEATLDNVIKNTNFNKFEDANAIEDVFRTELRRSGVDVNSPIASQLLGNLNEFISRRTNDVTKSRFEEFVNKDLLDKVGEATAAQVEFLQARARQQEEKARELARRQDEYAQVIVAGAEKLASVEALRAETQLKLLQIDKKKATLNQQFAPVNNQIRALTGGTLAPETINARITQIQDLFMRGLIPQDEAGKVKAELLNLQRALEIVATDTSRFSIALSRAEEAARKRTTVEDFAFGALGETNPVEVFRQVQAMNLAGQINRGDVSGLNRLNLPNFLQQLPRLTELIETFQGEAAAQQFRRNSLVGALGARGLLNTEFGQSLIKGLDKFITEEEEAKRIAKELANTQLKAAELQLTASEKLIAFMEKFAGLNPLPRNSGGIIPGFGPNKDTVPAMLTKGEFVVNRNATRANLPLLMAINNGYVNGGVVDGTRVVAIQRAIARRRRLGRDTSFHEAALASAMRGETVRRSRNTRRSAYTTNLLGRTGYGPDGDMTFPQLMRAIRNIAREAGMEGRTTTDVSRFVSSLSTQQRQYGSRLFQQYRAKRVKGFNLGGLVGGGSAGVLRRGLATGNNINTNVNSYSLDIKGLDAFTRALIDFGRYAESISRLTIPERITVEVAPVQVVANIAGETELAKAIARQITPEVATLLYRELGRHINTTTGETRDAFSQ